VSADSMAWSLQARLLPPTPGHTHKSCANCLEFALDWRSDLLAGVDRSSRLEPAQPSQSEMFS